MEVDYIIVGQGLMGTLLAASLEARGQRVFLFDEDAHWAASPVAVGIYHPLSGRGMRPSWHADLIFSTLEAHYRSLEQRWKARFLYPMPVYRPFISQEEALNFDPCADTRSYISSCATRPLHRLDYPQTQMLKDTFGGIMVKQSGQLDTVAFLSAARRSWQLSGLFSRAHFRYEQCVLPEAGGVLYNGLSAEALISCEGIGLQRNPFFRGLPLRPLVGEWIEGESSEPLPFIVNRKKYLVPRPQQRLRIGSTYQHVSEGMSAQPTQRGQAELLSGYHNLYRGWLRKKSAAAAARPASSDRRPWVGMHPRYAALGICNGLGTKGVSLGPYVAECMTHLLLEGQMPPEAVRLVRKHGLSLSGVS